MRVHRSAVAFDHRTYQRQPESRAPGRSARGEETVEHPRHVLGRDAGPGIGNAYRRHSVLDARRHAQITGLLRCLGSAQSWLRQREEFGVPGVESGPITRWAVDTLIAAVRRGELPDLEPEHDPTGGQP